MLLSRAVVLAEARSYLAALADVTDNPVAALDYERVLLQLDSLHRGTVPPITGVLTGDRDVLYDVARVAIATLKHHPVDRLELAMCLSMLEAGWEVDRPP